MKRIIYTYEVGVDKVLELRDKIGRMPSAADYEQYLSEEEIDAVYYALQEKASDKVPITNKYAFITIAAQKEVRRRNGQNPNIATPDIKKIPWTDKTPLSAEEAAIAAEVAAEFEADRLAELGGEDSDSPELDVRA